MKNNIEQIRKSKGLTGPKLAALIGTDASTISKLEKGKTKLTDAWLVRMAKGLGVDVSAIILQADADESAPALDLPSHATSRRVIPILGTAAASHLSGAIQFSESTVVNYIDAPPMLERADGIYGVYVEGDSMWPMYKHGEPVLASPYKSPKVGDGVIVQEKIGDSDTIKATLGIFQSRNGDGIKIGKLNPAATVEFPIRNVYAVHKVLDFTDILGG